MGRHSRVLSVVAIILAAAGAAAAQSILAGPSPGLSVNGGSPLVTQAPTPSTSPTPSTPPATTDTPSTSGMTGTPATPGPSTGTPTSPTSPTTAAPTQTVEEIVSFSQAVEAGTTGVSVFTVPAGRQLIVTDVLITNTAATPVCGASIGPNVTTTPPTPGATPPTPGATGGDAGLGVLCVPAQTSLSLGLTTGLEFAAGQSVVLTNAATTAGGTLNFHVRGFLAVPGA